MWDFLEKLKITPLSKEDREMLDAPLTLKELQRVVADTANQKARGPDGLPIEIFKKVWGSSTSYTFGGV